ncbi:MAG: L,D-transpeptidase [Actinomycetota bacterium]
MSPRAPVLIGIAIASLVFASCTDVPPDSASARTVERSLEVEPASSIPREFLEVGVNAPSDAREEPRRTAGVPPPRSLKRWAWVVRAEGDRIRVWSDPRSSGDAPTRVDAANPWDQRLAFPVMDVVEVQGSAWYRVLIGIEPNGSRGWVRAGDVTFHRVRHRVIVDLSERVLRHYRNGALRHRFSVGIGAPGTPTTTGRFFVWATLQPGDPTGPYGSFLLGLSGFSEVLTDWPGGGRIAIHGTTDASDRGRRVSYGCTRVYNPQMSQLRHIPMGTSVTIRR